nr:SIR2 family protein [Sphingomonas telluris]
MGSLLCIDSPDIGYICDFLKQTNGTLECIGTLNYDTLVEQAGKQENVDFDYGLSQWNERRVIRFLPSQQRLIKLHGSVNWYSIKRDEIVFEQSEKSWKQRPRAMVFGGQSEKLNPDGPFLSLRHEFQRALDRTNVLAIVGYSFSDNHLNAMLRSWVAVKRKAKLIVLDPEGLSKAAPLLRSFPTQRKDPSANETIEVVEIKGKFRGNVARLVEALKLPPKPMRASNSK